MRTFLSLLLFPAEQAQGERAGLESGICLLKTAAVCLLCFLVWQKARLLLWRVGLGKGSEGSAVVHPDASDHGLREDLVQKNLMWLSHGGNQADLYCTVMPLKLQ